LIGVLRPIRVTDADGRSVEPRCASELRPVAAPVDVIHPKERP
jgi:hypothetical protein